MLPYTQPKRAKFRPDHDYFNNRVKGRVNLWNQCPAIAFQTQRPSGGRFWLEWLRDGDNKD
ncbi:hypothetical protein [Roseovarius sp. M141]|uniref:hypothetical protein n=1 Tax=Roseovarius sp. M141 TaxID=2583806 RepID=UPI0020CBE1C9|nr:hypothetical protein [Roseovarius sp. M141]